MIIHPGVNAERGEAGPGSVILGSKWPFSAGTAIAAEHDEGRLGVLTWADILGAVARGNPAPGRRLARSDEEWRTRLEPDVYRVTRQKGTERPFSSEMCGLFEPGRYACACCDEPLFDAAEKFESGTGWPSFTQPVDPAAVAYHLDASHGMRRVETTCNTCGAHLGHVFPDGPRPSGLRYCINSLALRKVKEGED